MLELDLGTIGWQIFNFLVLMAALYFVLFRPVTASIRRRAEEKQREMQALQEERERVEQLRRELEARLAAAEEEVAAIVQRAREEADAERAALLEEARKEVERILAEAQTDAYRLKRQAIAEFHDELVSAVLEVSALVLGRVAPDEVQEAMVRELCDRVWELGQRDMRRVELLRQSLGDRTPTVRVRSARALGPELQGLLVRTLSALADRNVNLDVQVEPSLGLGLEVRLGDLVMDNTVAGQLEELRESVVAALEERINHE